LGETQGDIDEYSNAESINLKNIDGQKFTIVDWKKSDYDDKGTMVDGIKFTTEEEFNGVHQLHTTRTVVVRKFYTMKTDPNTKEEILVPTELGIKVKDGTKFAVICKEMKAKQGGNNYFDLITANKSKGKLD